MTTHLDKIIALEPSIRAEAETGTAIDKSTLGHLLYTKAFETLDIATLEEAEVWLTKAAEAGNKETEEYLKTTWIKVKGDVIDRIKNKS